MVRRRRMRVPLHSQPYTLMEVINMRDDNVAKIARETEKQHNTYSGGKWIAHVKRKMYGYTTRARKKHIRFDLDWVWYDEQYDKGCAITGRKFDDYEDDPFLASVDRIDNRLGYTKDNCRLILWCLNAGKSTLTEDQFRDVILEAAKYYR